MFTTLSYKGARRELAYNSQVPSWLSSSSWCPMDYFPVPSSWEDDFTDKLPFSVQKSATASKLAVVSSPTLMLFWLPFANKGGTATSLAKERMGGKVNVARLEAF